MALRSAVGRSVLAASVLGSSLALLAATVVNVALPAVGGDLHADVAGLQWIVNGYLLTLAALILIGGSLGDRYGRRRMLVLGTVVFAAASLACSLAPSVPVLVLARALQGMGGALLTPASLAIVQSTFRPLDRAPAIGAWAAWGGVAAAAGPLLGGWLVDVAGWRAVFALNVPLAALVVLAAAPVPETADPTASGRPDVLGAVLVALGLAGVTYALIAGPGTGPGPGVVAAAVAGTAALAAFVAWERRAPHPMLPLDVFASAQFTWTNVVTFVVYAALGGVLFLLVVHLQVALGYSALAAGAAALPATALLLLLSTWAGALAQRLGPRKPLTVGPLLIAVGVALLTRVVPGAGYATAVLPAVTVFGVGLAATVAPVTAAVLAAVDDRRSGVASAVNSAVARVAGLLAVAVLPSVSGLTRAGGDPAAFTAAFRTAMWLTAATAAVGGVVAWCTVDDRLLGDGDVVDGIGRGG